MTIFRAVRNAGCDCSHKQPESRVASQNQKYEVSMTRRTICLFTFLATTVTIALASVAPQAQPLVITGVNVVDVIDGQILSNSTVTISGDAILTVAQNAAPPENSRIVNGQGKFLIPGLWDMHAHIGATGETSLQLNVANGVTGIRDMGSDLDLILRLREATSTGRVLGPRIFAAGPILDNAPADWPFRMRVKTPEEGRDAVQMLKRRGVDLIKVHDNTPRDVYFAIAEEAKRQNLPVAGHVPRGTAWYLANADTFCDARDINDWHPRVLRDCRRASVCKSFG
jgi:imidazolonepropionase-like amidohydrolase